MEIARHQRITAITRSLFHGRIRDSHLNVFSGSNQTRRDCNIIIITDLMCTAAVWLDKNILKVNDIMHIKA